MLYVQYPPPVCERRRCDDRPILPVGLRVSALATVLPAKGVYSSRVREHNNLGLRNPGDVGSRLLRWNPGQGDREGGVVSSLEDALQNVTMLSPAGRRRTVFGGQRKGAFRASPLMVLLPRRRSRCGGRLIACNNRVAWKKRCDELLLSLGSRHVLVERKEKWCRRDSRDVSLVRQSSDELMSRAYLASRPFHPASARSSYRTFHLQTSSKRLPHYFLF